MEEVARKARCKRCGTAFLVPHTWKRLPERCKDCWGKPLKDAEASPAPSVPADPNTHIHDAQGVPENSVPPAPEVGPTEAKEPEALPKVGDILEKREKGYFYCCGYWPDGSPKRKFRLNYPQQPGAPTRNKSLKNGFQQLSISEKLARYIRKRTMRGQMLVNFWTDVVEGKYPKACMRDRLQAAEALSARAFGKPPDKLEVTQNGSPFAPGGASYGLSYGEIAHLTQLCRPAIDVTPALPESGRDTTAVESGDPVEPAHADAETGGLPPDGEGYDWKGTAFLDGER